MPSFTRRGFINAAAASAGTAFAPLGLLHASSGQKHCASNGESLGFGALSPSLPLNTAELTNTGPGNLSGYALLDLPPGFVYTAVSITGQTMSDGTLVPGDHDGMACFTRGYAKGWRNLPQANGAGNGKGKASGRRKGARLYYLVRNHELSPSENEFGNRLGVVSADNNKFDPLVDGGGTTTLVVNRRGQLLRDYASLSGTVRNCAGGPTPWRSWISCEEDVSTPASNRRVSLPHGYNFEVPVFQRHGLIDAIPLVDMGRFNHEAIAVDPESGYVYQTEDRSDGAFYRFCTKVFPRHVGDLQKGGDLYALALDPEQFSTCDGSYLPTRTTTGGTTLVDTGANLLAFMGQPLKVDWVKIDDVDPVNDTLRREAQSKGAALFRRGEGMWYHDGIVYFAATGGGSSGNGQVWAYDPKAETLTLLVDSPSSAVLDNVDNITVAPDGSLYLCEDARDSHVVGVDRAGRLFKFLRNSYDSSELAGACFSPDGSMFFINLQGAGITMCVFREDGRAISVPL